MPDEVNIICPECETENKPDTKRCSKCNYPLAAQKDFERMAAATAKKRRKSQPESEPEKKDGFFDVLS